MLQYDDSAFYFVALSFITIYIIPCKFRTHVIFGWMHIYNHPSWMSHFPYVVVREGGGGLGERKIILLCIPSPSQLFAPLSMFAGTISFFFMSSFQRLTLWVKNNYCQCSMVLDHKQGQRRPLLHRRGHRCYLAHYRREAKGGGIEEVQQGTQDAQLHRIHR
jgi:hypothetical protein